MIFFSFVQVAMEVLGWHKQDVCDILTSQMQVAPLLSDQNWATKRLRNIKFTSVHAVLLTLGQVNNGLILLNFKSKMSFRSRSINNYKQFILMVF